MNGFNPKLAPREKATKNFPKSNNDTSDNKDPIFSGKNSLTKKFFETDDGNRAAKCRYDIGNVSFQPKIVFLSVLVIKKRHLRPTFEIQLFL